MTRHTWFLDEVGKGRGEGMQAWCKSGESVEGGGGVAAQKRWSYIAQKKAPKSRSHNCTTLEFAKCFFFSADRFISSHETLIMMHAQCCLPLTLPLEDFNVKIHINHRVVQYHSPQIPTVGKTTPGQAGDTTLATAPGQIYQNLWNGKHMNLGCLGVLSTLGFPDW